ncbi:carboxypeptidase S [Ceratobasidium sp. AG-I]|nr:carboxypeptidase S [Ceratobasidium sp. AG-I]
MGILASSKEDLPVTTEPLARPTCSRRTLAGLFFAGLLALYPLSCALPGHHGTSHASYALKIKDVCPQVEPLALSSEVNRKLAEELGAAFSDPSFEAVAAEYLGAAVRIPTESYDGMKPVGEDPRWDIFYKFSEYLLQTYPKVHATLTLTRISTHALIYYWPGSDSSLKPILLTAHQDVVPVDPNTADSWVHPPYSGYYDGTWVWGRGSSDDKSGLVGIMVALEKLIEKGFEPRRGILVGFGIDEESSSREGAAKIAKHIEETYGKNSVSIMVDEGSMMQTIGNVTIAQLSVAEKGYLDVRVEVATPGGHSSVPPEHTSIGILASLLVEIEKTPYVPVLARSSPIYTLLRCFASHVPSIPSPFRDSILSSVCSSSASASEQRRCDEALDDVQRTLFNPRSEWYAGDEHAARSYKSLLGTTQAIDLITGGVKSNALPELASAIVNHRIRTDSSVSVLQESITAKLIPLAEKYNLTLTSFSQNITTGGAGTLTMADAFGNALDPAPVTPTEGAEAGPYRLLSGVIRYTMGDKPTIVSPAIMTGNTDTRFYWNITRHIFRYSHSNEEDEYNGIHTINEALRASGFVEIIQFFKNFILAADDSTEI